MKAIDLETRYSAHNYALLSVVPTRGQGAYLWDTAGATLRRAPTRRRATPRLSAQCWPDNAL
jgi:hypothetical protein